MNVPARLSHGSRAVFPTFLAAAALTLWAAAGEVVRVALHPGMGHAFAGNLEAAGDLLSSGLGLVGGVAAAIGLGHWLRAGHRDHAD